MSRSSSDFERAPDRINRRSPARGAPIRTPQEEAEARVGYEVLDGGVARITLRRAAQRNAQDVAMLYGIDAGFKRAAQDADVRVIILDAEGDTFSAGHDIRSDSGLKPQEFEQIGLWNHYDAPGQEGMMDREQEIYLGLCERWRNMPKPTIAAVQGRCIAGGLMLAWVCDLIVAADDAQFQDPVVSFGMCGAEFFMHPFEFGTRRAKHLLFTSDWLGAEDAREIGMVAEVWPRAELADRTLALARRIAQKPLFALKMAKLAVNRAQDAAGRRETMDHSFAIHQLCHSHWRNLYGIPVYPDGLPDILRSDIYRYFGVAEPDGET